MGKTIQEMPKELRPYEKCQTYGAEALTQAELLAIILRSGRPGENVVTLANRLLSSFHGSLRELFEAPESELRKIEGIGQVKAMQLSCLKQIALRYVKEERVPGKILSSAEIIADAYMEEMRQYKQEILKALFLDSRYHLIRDWDATKGSANASMVPVREILQEALRSAAVSVVLIHNHPSGDPEPSKADVDATKQVKEAAEIAGISLLDHLIIGEHQYISLRECGLL